MRIAWIVVAALALWACGGDDSSGGSEEDTGLSSVFKKFVGGSGAGSSTTGGTTPGGSTGGTGGNLSATDCQGLCQRTVSCVGQSCPNYLRIPASIRQTGESDCVSSCGGATISPDEMQQFNAASCDQITGLVVAEAPEFQDFCRQQPASDGECAQFCQLIAGCLQANGADPLQPGQCELMCIYGDGARCALQAGTCDGFASCQHLFPSDDE